MYYNPLKGKSYVRINIAGLSVQENLLIFLKDNPKTIARQKEW